MMNSVLISMKFWFCGGVEVFQMFIVGGMMFGYRLIFRLLQLRKINIRVSMNGFMWLLLVIECSSVQKVIRIRIGIGRNQNRFGRLNQCVVILVWVSGVYRLIILMIVSSINVSGCVRLCMCFCRWFLVFMISQVQLSRVQVMIRVRLQNSGNGVIQFSELLVKLWFFIGMFLMKVFSVMFWKKVVISELLMNVLFQMCCLVGLVLKWNLKVMLWKISLMSMKINGRQSVDRIIVQVSGKVLNSVVLFSISQVLLLFQIGVMVFIIILWLLLFLKNGQSMLMFRLKLFIIMYIMMLKMMMIVQMRGRLIFMFQFFLFWLWLVVCVWLLCFLLKFLLVVDNGCVGVCFCLVFFGLVLCFLWVIGFLCIRCIMQLILMLNSEKYIIMKVSRVRFICVMFCVEEVLVVCISLQIIQGWWFILVVNQLVRIVIRLDGFISRVRCRKVFELNSLFWLCQCSYRFQMLIRIISMLRLVMIWNDQNIMVEFGWFFGGKFFSVGIGLVRLCLRIRLLSIGIFILKWVFLCCMFGQLNRISGVGLLLLLFQWFFIVVIFVGWCFRVLRLWVLLISVCIGVMISVIYMVIESILWIVGLLCLCSRCQVVEVLMKKVVVRNVVIDMCSRWQGNDGLKIIVSQFIGIIWLLMILKFCGVCIQLLEVRIQNVEISVLIVIIIVVKKCRFGFMWFQLNSMILRKLVSRKNVVSILQVSSGLVMDLVKLEKWFQLVLNWYVMISLDIMFMLKLIVKIFDQK